MNAYQLAMRDPAAAAIFGLMPNGGADFGSEYSGAESTFGDDFGDDMGDDYGAEFGDDYGAEFGAAPKPTPQALAHVWRKHNMQKAHTNRRERLLEPNKGSEVKIERYSFSTSQALVLGVASALVMTNQPDTSIRPQRVTMNAPSPGFVTITEIKVANVSVTVGGVEDAFGYAAVAVGVGLDMPTLSPANRATVLGNYTGFVPPGFVGGAAFLFVANFKGPASIVA
ncbi:MAG: hypothetical protein ACREBG_01875 [Pyrinomonadaceae bacterium]